MPPSIPSPHPPPSRPAQNFLSSNIPPTTLLEILHEALLILNADIDDLEAEVRALRTEGGGELKEMEKGLRELGKQRGGLKGDMAWLEEYTAIEKAEKRRTKERNEGAKARTAMLDGNGDVVGKRIVRLGGYGMRDGVAGKVMSDDD